MSDPVVRKLADAILAGEPIDWPAIEARLGSSPDQSVAEALKTLSQVVVPRRRSLRQVASRRLPALLEIARLVAIASTIVGLLGALIAMQRLQVPRLGVMTAVLATFAILALMLDVGGADRRARALAACFWMVAASFATSGVRWIAQTWPALPGITLFSHFYAECFFAASLWQFARDFPMIKRFGRLDRVSLVALRLTLALGVGLFVANLIAYLLPGTVVDTWASPVQRMTRGSQFWDLVFGTALPALGVIAWRARAVTGHEATRVRFFLYGIAVSVAPILIEVIAEGLVPSFRETARTPYWRSVGAWLIYPPMFFLALITAYAVAVDNVLEFRVAIQRGLRYLLARWLLTWGATLPLALLVWRLYRESSRPLADALSDRSSRTLLVCAVAGSVILACRRYLTRLLDRWVLPGTDDPSAVLAQMTERMKHARTPLEVTTEFAGGAERALQTSTHAYLVRHGDLTPVGAATAPVPSPSLVPVLLEGSREPCVVSARRGHSYYSLMTEQDRAWIDSHEIAVLAPIVSGRSGSGLMGVVALQHRRNALTFSPDDLRFLRAAAGAASLACDVINTEQQSSGAVAAPPDEVGVQCSACGRVADWDAVDRQCLCGRQRWEPAVLPVHFLGRFVITSRLGAGGMGVVYRATELSLGRDVAIKTLTRLSPGAAHRLRLEARAMAALAHPYIAVLYGADTWRGTPFLTMEYLAGGTLGARLHAGPQPVRTALDTVLPLASALEHVHRAGRCHGDIKPNNIGFTREGVPKFLDFGLSYAILDEAGDPSTRGPAAGTPAYMAPEARDGEAAAAASDVWALSLVFYECVTGIQPFMQARSGAAVARAVGDALAQRPVSESPGLQQFFERAFAETSRFPQTAGELQAALRSLDITEPPTRSDKEQL